MSKALPSRFRLAWILILIAIVNSLCWTAARWSYENRLTAVQLTVDYDDTRTMADAYRVPHQTLLTQLKSRGITSLGLYFQTLSTLRDSGRIALVPRGLVEGMNSGARWKLPPAYTTLITVGPNQQALLAQIEYWLSLQQQATLPVQRVALGQGQYGLAIPSSRQMQNDAVVGFDPAQVAATHQAGMLVTARLSNSLNLTVPLLEQILSAVEASGAHVVICAEDEVLGYDSMIPQVAYALRQHHLLFGNIEFTKQRGWEDFALRTDGMLVRVHSVIGDEAAKVKPEVLVNRFNLAVKERDIRVAYIRLMRQAKGVYPAANTPGTNVAEKTALDQNLEFIGKLAAELQRPPTGMGWLHPRLRMAGAQAFGNYPMDELQAMLGSHRAAAAARYLGAVLAGLGVVGGALLLLNLFFEISPQRQFQWLLLGLAMNFLLAVSTGKGCQLLALGAGVFFPTIAMIWGGLADLWTRKDRGASQVPVGATFWLAVRIMLTTCALLLGGCLIIIALMDNWKYFGKADEFFGEKATLLVPLILAGVAFAGEFLPRQVAAVGAWDSQRLLSQRVRRLLAQPLTVRLALLSVVILVGGFIWIARTGNESGMEISTLELRFRSTLELLLITRPRTKEMFLGIPALFVAVWLARRGEFSWATAAIVIATIGTTDILNTFCHFHTPLFYSLLRTIHGLWIGALVGLVLIWGLEHKARRRVFSSYAVSPVEAIPGEQP